MHEQLTCKVCAHPKRADIDAAWRAAGGRGRNALAREFAIAPPTLSRHFKHVTNHPEEARMEPEICSAPGVDVPVVLAHVQAALARLEEQGNTRTQARDQQVEALQRQVQTCLKEGRQVREIVACIPLDATVLPTRMSKLEARVASEAQRTQAVEEGQRRLTRAVETMAATVGRVAEFFANMGTDANLWAACLNLGRLASQGTHSSALKEWLARVAGRQLSDNDKILQ